MKKLLLTVLASLSLVVTACTPAGGSSDPSSSEAPSSEAGPQVVTIKEAIEWDLENAAPYLDGQVVRLEDVSVTSNYGTSSLSVCWSDIAEDGTINDFVSMEVVTTEKTSFGWKDVVNVTGTVTSTNGRPHLKDATVEWAVDEETSKGAGSVIYSRYQTRAYWDHYASRAVSSSYFEATLQLASLPGTLTAGQGGSFQVVYPGEKLEISDDNWNIIDVMIPTLSEAEATMYNAAFEGLEVGDGVLMFAQSYFDSYPKALMVPETLRIQDGWVPTQLDIFQTWAETEAYIADTYQLDASFVPETFEDDSIYAWTVDDSLLDSYDCLNINAGTDEAAAVYEKFTDILDADETFTLVAADVEAEDGSVQSFYVINPVVNEAGELTDYDASIWVCDYTTQVILQIECPTLVIDGGRTELLTTIAVGFGLENPTIVYDEEEKAYFILIPFEQMPLLTLYGIFDENAAPALGLVANDGEFEDNSADTKNPYIFDSYTTTDGTIRLEIMVYDMEVQGATYTVLQVAAYLTTETVDPRADLLQQFVDYFELNNYTKVNYAEGSDAYPSCYYIQLGMKAEGTTLLDVYNYFVESFLPAFVGAAQVPGAFQDMSASETKQYVTDMWIFGDFVIEVYVAPYNDEMHILQVSIYNLADFAA